MPCDDLEGSADSSTSTVSMRDRQKAYVEWYGMSCSAMNDGVGSPLSWSNCWEKRLHAGVDDDKVRKADTGGVRKSSWRRHKH